MESSAAAPQDWSRYTPASIEPHVCLARTWNQGLGGQCPKSRRSGSEFCGLHATKWQVHGRVDGPIPEQKFLEFERCNRNTPKKLQAAAGESRSAATATNAGATRKRKAPTPSSVAGERPRTRSQTSRASSNGNRDQATAGAARTGTAAKLPKARAAKQPKAKPEKAVKCTCGKPIHSERCKLFRPRASVYGSAPSAHARHAHTRPTNGSAKADSSRARFSIASIAQLTDWARQQVVKVAAEVEALPRQEQKAAWKQRLRLFHPDKREAAQREPNGLLAGRSEAELKEVFVELKRRYDRAAVREERLAELVRRRGVPCT